MDSHRHTIQCKESGLTQLILVIPIGGPFIKNSSILLEDPIVLTDWIFTKTSVETCVLVISMQCYENLTFFVSNIRMCQLTNSIPLYLIGI